MVFGCVWRTSYVVIGGYDKDINHNGIPSYLICIDKKCIKEFITHKYFAEDLILQSNHNDNCYVTMV